MVIYCVEIGNVAVIMVKIAVEIVGLVDANRRVDDGRVIGRINGKVESDDAVTAVNSLKHFVGAGW